MTVIAAVLVRAKLCSRRQVSAMLELHFVHT